MVSLGAALGGAVRTWMTVARSTSPGLLCCSFMAGRLGLTVRLAGTLVGAECVLLVYFRRTGSDSLVVKAGRGMLVDPTGLHTVDGGLLDGAVWWPRTLGSRRVSCDSGNADQHMQQRLQSKGDVCEGRMPVLASSWGARWASTRMGSAAWAGACL